MSLNTLNTLNTVLTFCLLCCSIFKITDSEQINKDKLKDNYFIMFYTNWCRHCKHVTPVWDQLINTFHDSSVNFIKFNCETDEEFCIENQIYSFPTFIFYKLGDTPKVFLKENHKNVTVPELASFVSNQTGYPSVKYSEKEVTKGKIYNGPMRLNKMSLFIRKQILIG